jgi:hypothetical protein
MAALGSLLPLAASQRSCQTISPPTNMNGPDQPFDPSTSAAVQLSHSCHSCIAQHFRNPNDGSADGSAD